MCDLDERQPRGVIDDVACTKGCRGVRRWSSEQKEVRRSMGFWQGKSGVGRLDLIWGVTCAEFKNDARGSLVIKASIRFSRGIHCMTTTPSHQTSSLRH